MTLSDYFPLMLVVGLIVGAIMALRIFFTLWSPIDRRLNGDRFTKQSAHLNELRDKTVDVRFKSGATLSGVTLRSYIATSPNMPYQLKSFLVAQTGDGRNFYLRAEEIEYIAQQPPPLESAAP